MKKIKFTILMLVFMAVGCSSNSLNVKNYEVTGKLKDTLDITKVDIKSVQEKNPFNGAIVMNNIIKFVFDVHGNDWLMDIGFFYNRPIEVDRRMLFKVFDSKGNGLSKKVELNDLEILKAPTEDNPVATCYYELSMPELDEAKTKYNMINFKNLTVEISYVNEESPGIYMIDNTNNMYESVENAKNRKGEAKDFYNLFK